MQIVGLVLLGLGVGIFSTGLGLGGGVLMVPAFITFVSGMDLHTAKGTSLVLILLVALSGFVHLRRMQPVRPALGTALWLTGGALAGGYIGAAVSTRVSEKVVLLFFLVFLGSLILQLIWTKPIAQTQHQVVHKNAVLFLIGLLAGITGSATGTGGGTVLAPLILLTGVLPHTQMVYVSNQVIIATSLAAAPPHFMAESTYAGFQTVGHVALGLVPVLFLAAQAGVYLGAKMNLTLQAHQRRRILAIVLALVTARMLLRLWMP